MRRQEGGSWKLTAIFCSNPSLACSASMHAARMPMRSCCTRTQRCLCKATFQSCCCQAVDGAHLQQMVLHDIADDAKLVKVAAPPLCPKGLLCTKYMRSLAADQRCNPDDN